jgi:hypothetical protein
MYGSVESLTYSMQVIVVGFTYLRGITDYGDCVDDEWLIVFILRELTKKVPGLWAHVCDSDGEFLLIEAANAVPNWINPEVDQNRVWVHEGKIHLIPPSLSPDWGGFHNLSLVEAFGLIQMHHVSVPHFPALEIEAFSRLASYPEQITSCEYHCLLRMPRKLAYILHLRPKFIAPAIEAFKARESLGLRAIETAHFLPTFPAHDMVTTSVQFTKTLFVQLRSQQFTLPPAWGCTASELCRQDHRNESSSLNDERLELGMRVAIGFELLIQKARHRPSHTTRELAVLLGDLENGVSVLPTDYHIMAWENSTRQDDDRWLDIDYCDLEAELDGHKRTSESENMTGFGDPKMHVDLKRIVARFQEFLQDDAAELGGPNETLDEDDPERYSDNGERKRDGCDGWDSDNELYSNDGGDVILDKDELGQLVDSLKLVRSGSDWAVGEQRSLDSEISTNGRSQYDSFSKLGCAMEAELKSHETL